MTIQYPNDDHVDHPVVATASEELENALHFLFVLRRTCTDTTAAQLVSEAEGHVLDAKGMLDGEIVPGHLVTFPGAAE